MVALGKQVILCKANVYNQIKTGSHDFWFWTIILDKNVYQQFGHILTKTGTFKLSKQTKNRRTVGQMDRGNFGQVNKMTGEHIDRF